MGILNIGQSALNAAYTRLQTTSHNIANASTPGYSRQEVLTEARPGQLVTGQFIGGGVEVAGIRRSYDQFATRELNSALSAQAADEARANALGRLDQLFSDAENGIGAQYDSFNAGMADMVNQPFDESARTVALQRADDLARSVSSGGMEVGRIADETYRQTSEAAGQLNAKLQELADVNGRIAGMADGVSQQNDLLDRRDQLVAEISQSIKAEAHINDNNTVSLFASTGDTLVISEKAASLSVEYDVRDPGQIRLYLETEGRNLPLNDDNIAGGELSGLIQFYNNDLRAATTRLGQMAAGLAEAYNGRQALGLDADLQPGSKVFTLGSPLAEAASTNAGNAEFAVIVDDGSAIKASDYSIRMTGGTMMLTRLSDGQETALGGLPQTIDGLTIDLNAGAMAEGDVVSIRSASALASGFEVAMQSGRQWANAMPVIPVSGEGNNGSVTSTAFSVDAADPNGSETVTITFTGAGTFDVSGTGTGNPTGVPYTPGEAISYNGWNLTLSGEPQAGDTVEIRPTSDPLADNRNARALYQLGTSGIVDGNTLNESVSGLIGDIGAKTQSANADLQQSRLWTESAQAARDSVSGVNLDEEAARLLQYQQAYQAAAKLISTAQNMFDSLISAVR